MFVSQRPKGIKNLSQEIAKIKGGETIVVDIARLADDEQTLVFGDILQTIYSLYDEEGSERENLAEKVIIFADELNKYAPARERESPIIEQVLDIAERDQSLRVILIGAEQFMSAVHERVVGNWATTIIGRTGSDESSGSRLPLFKPGCYSQHFSLQKRELVISHAIFRQLVTIRFSRYAYLQEST